MQSKGADLNATVLREHHLPLSLLSSELIGDPIPLSPPLPFSSRPSNSRDYHLQTWEIYMVLGSDSSDRWAYVLPCRFWNKSCGPQRTSSSASNPTEPTFKRSVEQERCELGKHEEKDLSVVPSSSGRTKRNPK